MDRSVFSSPMRRLLAGALGALLLTGCDKVNDASDELDPALTEDVALELAGAMSQEGGGVADQLEDVAYAASSSGMQFGVPPSSEMLRTLAVSSPDTSYDEGTGWWTISFSRSFTRSNELGDFETSFERVYQVQFLDQNGQAQRTYIESTPSGNDTAYTINFKIVSGTGMHRSPWRVHILRSLSADWVVTGANLPVVTINGTYARSAVDTLTTANSTRTHDNTLTATMIDVTKPRYRMGASRDDLGGTIEGTFHSIITFTRGDLYRERDVTVNFTIDLSGEDANIGINDPRGNRIHRFHCGWKFGRFFGRLN